MPRTRTVSALKVVRAYARRVHQIDRLILACFVLGLSTRKVAKALLPILGQPVSPATVSQMARQLDAAVGCLPPAAAAGPLSGAGPGRRRAQAQDSGAGALARPVLVALGVCTPMARRRSSTSVSRPRRAPPGSWVTRGFPWPPARSSDRPFRQYRFGTGGLTVAVPGWVYSPPFVVRKRATRPRRRPACCHPVVARFPDPTTIGPRWVGRPTE